MSFGKHDYVRCGSFLASADVAAASPISAETVETSDALLQ